MRNGTVIRWLQQLHEKYGDAVRVNPTEVSFISGETAWQDIYGVRTGKHKTGAYLKDRTWYLPPPNGAWSLLGADEEDHARMRRSISHAFSDKALREQEGVIQGFVDLLVQRLNDQLDEGKGAVDLTRWYNFTTFDIITDLTFGESVYCLRDKEYHPWVSVVFGALRLLGFLAAQRKSALFFYRDRLFKWLFSGTDMAKAGFELRKSFWANTAQKMTDRLEKGSHRPDFISHILANQSSKEKSMSREEIDSNSVLFLVAGSETSATLLSGLTFLLCSDERCYRKLVQEVRGRFESQGEITIKAVSELDYLGACLQEALRYYPPVPTGFPRIVPSGGDMISGRYIPEGVSPKSATFGTKLFAKSVGRRQSMFLNTRRIAQPAIIRIQTSSFQSAGSGMRGTKMTTGLH